MPNSADIFPGMLDMLIPKAVSLGSLHGNANTVMELLQDLHRQGSTICMVTHDPRFAQHAERVINLFDGRIVA